MTKELWSLAANDLVIAGDDEGEEPLVCVECQIDIDGTPLFDDGDPLCQDCYREVFGD